MASPYYNPYQVSATNGIQPWQIPIPVGQSQPAPQPFALDTVQGKAAADIYQVLAGQEVILFDLDAPFVYRKKRDAENKLIVNEQYQLVPYVETPATDIPQANPINMDDINRQIQEMVDAAVQERFAVMMGAEAPKKKGGK